MSVARATRTAASGLSRSAVGHAVYAMLAVAAVVATATVRTDGYVANILLQAVSYAIAVFGLSVVLGLCGQINLAQAAFFALGAYAVALGTVVRDRGGIRQRAVGQAIGEPGRRIAEPRGLGGESGRDSGERVLPVLVECGRGRVRPHVCEIDLDRPAQREQCADEHGADLHLVLES